MEWFVAAEFGKKGAGNCRKGDENNDSGKHLHTGASWRGKKDTLEVNWNEVDDKEGKHRVKEGDCKSSCGRAISKEAERNSWRSAEIAFFEEEKSNDAQEAKDESCNGVVAFPGPERASISERNENQGN